MGRSSCLRPETSQLTKCNLFPYNQHSCCNSAADGIGKERRKRLQQGFTENYQLHASPDNNVPIAMVMAKRVFPPLLLLGWTQESASSRRKDWLVGTCEAFLVAGPPIWFTSTTSKRWLCCWSWFESSSDIGALTSFLVGVGERGWCSEEGRRTVPGVKQNKRKSSLRDVLWTIADEAC